MDSAEAADVAQTRLHELRRLPYTQLVAEWLDQPRSEYATARSGRRYNLEIEAIWDDKRQRNLRVWVIVDDGGRSAMRPLTRDFIVAPDGSFIDD